MLQTLAGRPHLPTPMPWLLRSALRSTIRSGALEIEDSTGAHHRFGDGSGQELIARFRDPLIEAALLKDPQLAIGEGYMQGRIEVERGSIYDLLALFARNIYERPLPSWMQFADRFRILTRLRRQRNKPTQSKSNVARHYDLPDALYGLFLDSDRQYSCAYFARGDESLEEAQTAKKHLIARKLCLEPGMSVLDIGCGWGGLARHIAHESGANVTGITLSESQYNYAVSSARQERGQKRGNVAFRLQDYRSVEESFDRIVSVGMFEHVGVPNYRRYFDKIADCLKPNGVALVHTIGRLSGPGITNPFIEKYIFPGGYVPALSEVVPHIEAAGLLVTDIEILRLHYAKTLNAWRHNFVRAWKDASAMLSEEFCRMWEFYLAGCEVAFRYHNLAVFQIQLAKRIDAVPINRDYLTAR